MRSTLLTLVAGAAMVASVACNGDSRRSDSARAAGQSTSDRSAAAGDRGTRPINLTGCLQQGSSRSFILTRVNEPAQKGVGTSGSGEAVEREQLREAANSYRIRPQDQIDLKDMVGKQVRVSGTLAEASDLPKPGTASAGQAERNESTSGTPGTRDRADRNRSSEQVDQDDLAEINATSVSVVSPNCGR
jgi:hypothetical protein